MATKTELDGAPPPSAASVAAAASLAKDMSNIFWAVGFYWVISISMVFVNKTLLSSPTGKIDAPFFITWYQCLVTVIVVYAMGQAGVASVPKFELRPQVVRQMVSLSVVFTCMIVFNNLCLKYVEVSFYQVARSLTIVFNVIFDFWCWGSSRRCRRLAAARWSSRASCWAMTRSCAGRCRASSLGWRPPSLWP
eukprot:TRINITY_DN482_c0_g1_i11.p2 TRINITY_DN482_c0_g1~~TRINITY_DN482_c0_g1_i11.p2  ORF type:complete len:200 (-),score=78.84 TRINITY_DN482_c0_g1_i11:738-1316(-)